jgi:UPF0271 protein
VAVSLEPFGDSAWRVGIPEGSPGRAILGALRALPGVQDAVVAERHTLVVFDPNAPPRGVVEAVERALAGGGAPATTPRVHTVRARYDGADLDEVAARAGTSKRGLAELHASREYVVAAIGFLPGFAYLRGLDARMLMPRRASPRVRVPALAIGVAGPYCGVYPFASSGGWNLIGTAVDFTPFQRTGASAGATLDLGDRVHFEAVDLP